MESNSPLEQAINSLRQQVNQNAADTSSSAASIPSTPDISAIEPRVIESGVQDFSQSDINQVLGIQDDFEDDEDIFSPRAVTPNPNVIRTVEVDPTTLPNNSAYVPGEPTSDVSVFEPAVGQTDAPEETITVVTAAEPTPVDEFVPAILNPDEEIVELPSTLDTIIEEPTDLFEQFRVVIRKNAEQVIAETIAAIDDNRGVLDEDSSFLYRQYKALKTLDELSELNDKIDLQTKPVDSIEMYDPRLAKFESTVVSENEVLPPESKDPGWKTRWDDLREILSKKEIDAYKAQVNVTSLRSHDAQRRVLYAVEAALVNDTTV